MKSASNLSNANFRSPALIFAQRTGAFCIMAIAVFVLTARLSSAQAQTFSTIYSFTGGGDGAYPYGLTFDSAGNIYGVTFSGGSPTCAPPYQGCGTVFKVDPSGKFSVVYHFTGGADGAHPISGLLFDPKHSEFYGITYAGGDLSCVLQAAAFGLGCGTVFKLDAAGHETVLHAFTGVPDAAGPSGALALDTEGNLYGTSGFGGGCSDIGGCGAVFKVDAFGNESVLFSFNGGPAGNVPLGVNLDSSGDLHGVTAIGGAYSAGVAYKLDSSGNQTILHNFKGGLPDGQQPDDAMAFDGPHMYGTTIAGGFGFGTVYEMDPSGKEAVVYRFAGPPDGSEPESVLVHDSAGNLYGTTINGGESACEPPYGCGTVFRVDNRGNEKILYRFTGGVDGAIPFGGVIRDSAGNLYGTTSTDVEGHGFGAIFKITP